jgi:6-phosphofructokinase
MSSRKRNAIVAQSGGPSPVINASLLGVIDGCADFSEHIGSLYAAWHGVEGILLEELIDMSNPAGSSSSCARRPLPEQSARAATSSKRSSTRTLPGSST